MLDFPPGVDSLNLFSCSCRDLYLGVWDGYDESRLMLPDSSSLPQKKKRT